MDPDAEYPLTTEIIMKKSQKALGGGPTETRMLKGIGLALLAIASEMKRANDLAEKMMAESENLFSCPSNDKNSNSVRNNPPPPDDEPRPKGSKRPKPKI